MKDYIPDILMLCISLWLAKVFISDLRSGAGSEGARKLEGAQPCRLSLCVFGALCALVVLALFTWAEYCFGVSQTQSSAPFFALAFWLSSAFIEELVFRGYFVVKNRGRAALMASIFGFSALFTLAHPFFWSYAPPDGAADGAESVLSFNFGANAVISSLCIFTLSLLFYWLRFAPQNVKNSIIPCIVAHFTYNFGVYFIKLIQGHIVF